MSQIAQSPTQFTQQQPDHGNPFMGFLGNAIGTFLPMAFGLPPIPGVGNVLGGLMGGGGSHGFGQIPGLMGGLMNYGFNPFQGQFNPYGNFGNPFQGRGYYDQNQTGGYG